MRAYASGGTSATACDIVNIGMVDVAGGLHGELRWLHTSRTIGTGVAMSLYAAPYPGNKTSHTVGATTLDNVGCSWDGYHVHQGTLVDCMAVNTALSPTTVYSVFDIDRYLHEIDYAEGLSLCNG